MRVTIVLDDELLQKVQTLTQVHEKSALIRMVLKTLIERERERGLTNLEAVSRNYTQSHAGKPITLQLNDPGRYLSVNQSSTPLSNDTHKKLLGLSSSNARVHERPACESTVVISF